VNRPKLNTVAIIGAGIAGASAANALAQAGFAVDVFDKSRGIGGRTATRRTEFGEFDHGARFFKAETTSFQNALTEAPVAPWEAIKTTTHQPAYVALPRQNQLAKHWLADLPVHLGERITQVSRSGTDWQLSSDQGHQFGNYRGLVVAIPAPQATTLLESSDIAVPSGLQQVSMSGVWALLLSLSEPLAQTIYTQPDADIDWLGANFAKPGRQVENGTYPYVAHASAKWSRQHLEDGADEVAQSMLQILHTNIGRLPLPVYCTAHRWRFGVTVTPLGKAHLSLRNLPLVLAGDWCLGANVEDAYHSGISAAAEIAQTIG
jgi:predicted NAD/FAD-dependent oxidoreductase